MSSGMRRTGDWHRVRNVTSHLAQEMLAARDLCLKRFALKAEAIVKGHISAQDLGWRPLRAKTIALKAKKGQSTNIYVASGTYFRNITGWVSGNTALVGVRRGARGDNATDLGQLARMLEFGSVVKKIPARKLWQPSMQEAVEWTLKNNNPARVTVERLRRY